MMDNSYDFSAVKTLKIGIIGKENLEQFQNLLVNNILHAVKICPKFQLQTSIINIDDDPFYYNYNCNYNFIFYLTTIEKLKNDNNLLSEIKKLSQNLINPRNHLFIIIDGCDNMEIDDDGDLVFSDNSEHILFQKFDEKISELMNDNLYHICKISLTMSNILKIILNDSSIINLSEDQINIIAMKLIKKKSKLSLTDKKKEIKLALKKININDKLLETGYMELSDNITKYFKLLHQKKIVCQNYLFAFDKININIDDIDNINNLLKEIYDISFLKTELHDDLIDKIDTILYIKIKQFYEKCKNNITIDSNQNGNIDAYKYHNFLAGFMDIAKGYNLSNIMEITKLEMEKINNIIIDYHKKEVEKVTDLEKISSLLEIFATRDKNNLTILFEKIKNHPKIMIENIEKMDKWVLFIDKCLKIGIPKDSVVRLIEEIIMSKIMFYCDLSKTNSSNISILYPQCLHVFLLSNIGKNFIFKKLYMFICYSIRYSGRNIADFIKNLKQEQYQNLLLLENKLLEICTIPIDEQNQPINLSDVDIVETFNENSKKIEIKNDSDKKSEDKKHFFMNISN